MYSIGSVNLSDVKSALTKVFGSGINNAIASITNTLFAMVDNSTGKWKSRLQLLKNYSPAERLAWYIEKISGGDQWAAVQYAEMFGNRADQIPDSGSLTYDQKRMFNEVATRVLFPNGAQTYTNGWTYDRNYVLFPLPATPPAGSVWSETAPTTPGSTPPTGPADLPPGSKDPTKSNMGSTILWLGLAGAAFMLISGGRKN
jgi:hypothetical protein